ncbi:tyrosine-protein phosphatase non-receptor type 22 isoform X2 [Salarias fasciatus]|uniref:tyrosine-protein phosphatase non-receptor type 22 isoform X2 n=1 Tax=Salarias fasciatus TaxID=181472 RepID=UPI0011767EC0|nr:tyrosine-protein phosphatase non-receptor type 22-like isoform X2 [Salarias fasciatus]
MEQQAWILRSLLAQLESQETADEGTPNSIAGEFARLKSLSTKYRTDKTLPTKTAEKQENIKKNRYKDIVPFDHTRVKLTFTTAKNDSDYINASFIQGVSGSRAYIATQGPLPHTVVDFLRMIWEYNVQVVVMACREFEMGKKKCEIYWPQGQDKSFVCEPFTVYCDSEENKGDYLMRTLRMTHRNCSRTLKQLHYVNWPDHGVPDSIPPILDMLHDMRSFQAHEDVPICIHCSAGCGRTGALCVIDYTWNLLKNNMIASNFCIFDLVQNMRTQRPSVVQTKEQYELVYRTIKFLFERYLEIMDSQTCQNELTPAAPAIVPAVTASELSDIGEDLDLKTRFQHLLDEERDVMQNHHAPSASQTLIPVKAGDMQSDWQQQHLLRTRAEALSSDQDLHEEPRTPPKPVRLSQRTEERALENEAIPPLNLAPSPAVRHSICLTVEDPYFETPMSSPSSEEAPTNPAEDQWTRSPVFSPPSLLLNDQTMEPNCPASGNVEVHTDGEAPPPLPERTPESYELAGNAGPADPCEMLSVIIPRNAAAEAVRELGGGPPSPVPPLPERTPESFELASDQASSSEQRTAVKPAVDLNVIGVSSEWSGYSNPNPAAATFHDEAKMFTRSKSLKVKMTSTAPVTTFDLTSNVASNTLPDPPTRPQLPQTEEDPTPPLPERTAESFILGTEEIPGKTSLHPDRFQTADPSSRTGTSSEWGGSSQPKFFDVIMSRSKSVRARGSSQEPLTAARQLTPLPVVLTGGGSAQGSHDGSHWSPPRTNSSDNTPDRNQEKAMTRSKSMKFFRPKHKSKPAPTPPLTEPGALSQLPSTSSSPFKFGFGNRFGKPKGPRKYPETWV